MSNTIKILNIPITNIRKTELLTQVNHYFQKEQPALFIVTANPEIIMQTKTSSAYKTIIEEANYVLADGIGVIIGSKILGTPLDEKLPGFELMLDFLTYASKHDKRVYFYGAKPGIAAQAASNATEQYKGLQVAGHMDGYTTHGLAAATKIAHTKPDFVFVAMGAPRQEQWIAEFKHLFPNTILIGVGGSLDVLSGSIKRAPAFWTKNNLEWLYRLITQPTRAKRMLKIPLFLLHVLKERFIK